MLKAPTLVDVDYEPSHIGPVWDRNEDGSWRLPDPDRTLGWEVIEWCGDWLWNDETDEPWSFTPEQLRFVLWFYAVDHRGRFVYRDAVLQRMKGWGKDPLAAVLCLVEFIGPCRFSHWDDEGYPVARRETAAWVGIAAVALDQTANTSSMFARLLTAEAIAEYDVELNKEKSYAFGGTCKMEVLSTSSRALEGKRLTFAVKNETHQWVKGNGGYDPDNASVGLSSVIMRTLGKIKGGQAHGLSITNAYNPSEASYAKSQREEYLATIEKRGKSTTLFDSLEAPHGVTLEPPFTRWDPELGKGVVEYDESGDPVPASLEETHAHLSRLISKIRGDATWLDVERLVDDILSGEMSLEEAKRFYLNSIVLGDDASFDPEDIAATADKSISERRRTYEGDPLRAGWAPVKSTDPIVVFGDGSKSDDATGLVGCRLSDGYIFTLGIWQKPKQGRIRQWTAPRGEVDARVHEIMGRFNVVAFWFDPSHAKDDEDLSRYWDGLVDAWHQEYGEKLEAWAQQAGDRRSAIGWDMTSPAREVDFVSAVERFTDEIESRAFLHDGHPALVAHLENCRRRMTRAGLSVGKITKNSSNKIDLGVCAIGARMLRRVVMNKGYEQGQPTDIWYR